MKPPLAVRVLLSLPWLILLGLLAAAALVDKAWDVATGRETKGAAP